MEITKEQPEGKVKKLIKEMLGSRLSYLPKGTQVYVVKDYIASDNRDSISVYTREPEVGIKHGKKISWAYDFLDFQLWQPLTPAQAKQLSYSKVYLWEV